MRLLLGKEECRDPGQYLSVNGVAAQLTLPLLKNRSETRPGSDIVTRNTMATLNEHRLLYKIMPKWSP